MACISSYIVGACTLALLIYDMIEHEWSFLLTHGVIGILLTGLFWGLCFLVGDGIALAILVIPSLVFLAFSLGIVMTGESLKRQGCCVDCSGKRTDKPKEECIFDGKLKAESLI